MGRYAAVGHRRHDRDAASPKPGRGQTRARRPYPPRATALARPGEDPELGGASGRSRRIRGQGAGTARPADHWTQRAPEPRHGARRDDAGQPTGEVTRGRHGRPAVRRHPQSQTRATPAVTWPGGTRSHGPVRPDRTRATPHSPRHIGPATVAGRAEHTTRNLKRHVGNLSIDGRSRKWGPKGGAGRPKSDTYKLYRNRH